MQIVSYIIINVLAILFGQIVGHLCKKLPPVVSEEITYKEFFSTLNKDFKIDFLYTIIFILLYNLVVIYNGFNLLTVLYTVVVAALAITFSIDIRYQLIPDEVHIVLLIVGIIKLIADFSLRNLLDGVIGALIGGGIFLIINLIALLILKKEGMGYGDIKLMAALGFIFGVKNILVITLVSFVFGAIVGGIVLIIKNKESDGYIPFGPFIAIAVLILMFVPADTIINIYISFCTWLGDRMTDGIYYIMNKGE